MPLTGLVCSAGRKVPNVIIDKKGQSDDDEDDDATEEKNDFLGRGDEGDDQLLQPQPAPQNEDVNGEGKGDDDHGQFVQFVHCRPSE